MIMNQPRAIVALALAIVTVPATSAGTKEELQAMNQVEPAWAASAVWYQIFPERFRNGDPSNDPTADDIRGADPLSPPQEWQIHPWGSDWYRLQPYERANGDKSKINTHLLRRRYGGDLQGILEKLDYLQALGITALYLNPVFTAPSLHKYDGATYHHIDPQLWAGPRGRPPHDRARGPA